MNLLHTKTLRLTLTLVLNGLLPITTREQSVSPRVERLDTRLGWRIAEQVELSVAGQNLLRTLHAEFGDGYGLDHTLVQRSVVGKVTWRF